MAVVTPWINMDPIIHIIHTHQISNIVFAATGALTRPLPRRIDDGNVS
jgi:hypothetical protein